MNPEFRRNLWLELTPRRVTTMTVVLLLIFFAAALSGADWTPSVAAVAIYYFIVVFWGTRNAALSVVGEIRDRTWDLQRLSSISALQMTWGKLFGSTIFNWYGGAICLAVILVYQLSHNGVVAGALDLVHFVVIGLIAQSIALLASLVAALRRQSHTRLEVFSYQAAGLIAAIAVSYVWEAADPAGSLVMRKPPPPFIPWWGQHFDGRGFLLISLAVFTGWILIGCYRSMRLELKMHNGPGVWLAFLVFMGFYVAGFDAWLPHNSPTYDLLTLRLALVAVTYAVLTYVMVLLEPKDLVLYRWLGGEIGSGRIGAALREFQGWMMSFAFAAATIAALVVWLLHEGAGTEAAVVAAALGFLTRDAAIFVALQTLPGQRRGDFAALISLFALYVLAPAILSGLALKAVLVLFYPQVSDPAWLSPAIGWIEALGLASFAIGRLAIAPKPVPAAA